MNLGLENGLIAMCPNELTVAFDNCNEEYYRDEGWKSIKITYQGSC